LRFQFSTSGSGSGTASAPAAAGAAGTAGAAGGEASKGSVSFRVPNMDKLTESEHHILEELVRRYNVPQAARRAWRARCGAEMRAVAGSRLMA
jgi:hypothetical protein